MVMESLLGSMSPRMFVDEHFLRLPMAMPGRAARFESLGTWETLDVLLRDVEPEDVLVARGGERWREHRSPDPRAARRLFAEGYTVLVRHAERRHAGLRELAAQFKADFHAAVDVHLYATPAGRFGFGWHYDAEDVFILQTHGRKHYRLRKNTVNPWPLVETIPHDMRYERELMPLMSATLEAGDWLYIPNGYWHRADAETDAISLAMGVLPPTGVDAFDALRERLLTELRWRQRLPIMGAAAGRSSDESRAEIRERLRELAADLAGLLTSEAVVTSIMERFEPGEPSGTDWRQRSPDAPAREAPDGVAAVINENWRGSPDWPMVESAGGDVVPAGRTDGTPHESTERRRPAERDAGGC